MFIHQPASGGSLQLILYRPYPVAQLDGHSVGSLLKDMEIERLG
jgi:hypothetical protein